MQTKMFVMTMRTQGRQSSVREMLRMKEQLKSCLEFGSDIPGIWFWALGQTSDDEDKLQDAEPKPETDALWQEIAELLRCAWQPVFGVSVGRVGVMAAAVLDVCDYVFADTQSKLRKQAWLGTPQTLHAQLADVVLETTEALYKRCQRMAWQIEKLNLQELLKIKKTFHCLRLRQKLEPAGKVSASVRLGSVLALPCSRGMQKKKVLSIVPEEGLMI